MIKGEDSFAFEDVDDAQFQEELPESRNVDRPKTVKYSYTNDIHISCAELYIFFYHQDSHNYFDEYVLPTFCRIV